MGKRDSFTIDQLIELYEVSNQAEGKSRKTIDWYSYILNTYSRYAIQNWESGNVSSFNIDNIRQYILDLRNRKCFDNHTYTHTQNKPVSGKMV